MKGWYKERHVYSNETLLKELRVSEPEDYRNYMHMNSATFDELLKMVAPIISKKNTVMRESIPAYTRLSVTLRYLATGNTFEDLKFGNAVSPQSISRIVMETCRAIIHCLKGYIKVIKMHTFSFISEK